MSEVIEFPTAHALKGEAVAGVPRLTIILHPNTSRIDVTRNDRVFNYEQYSFSRKAEPVGAEKALLDILNTHIIGIDAAKASKNTLQLEICDGMLLSEFIPQVITAVKHFGGEAEPYNPEIFVENRRYSVDPIYDHEDGYTISEGVRERAGTVDIGVPYKVFVDGR
jgi:hypothetical protein